MAVIYSTTAKNNRLDAVAAFVGGGGFEIGERAIKVDERGTHERLHLRLRRGGCCGDRPNRRQTAGQSEGRVAPGHRLAHADLVLVFWSERRPFRRHRE